MAGVPDMFAGRQAAPTAILSGPCASDLERLDVLVRVDEAWGKSQSLLGYPIRRRCEQADAAGWEFRRAAERATDSARRLDEDDTTLQIVALRGFCKTPAQWQDLIQAHTDVAHQDFEQLGEARFTGMDHTNSPVCLFRSGQLVIRVRMTGTLAQRQYTRIYALDVSHHLDGNAYNAWASKVAAS